MIGVHRYNVYRCPSTHLDFNPSPRRYQKEYYTCKHCGKIKKFGLFGFKKIYITEAEDNGE